MSVRSGMTTAKEMNDMDDFRGEWARRVGERLLNGEGFDPEEDRPNGYYFDAQFNGWVREGSDLERQLQAGRHSCQQPPVAEAVTDPGVEITITPEQYEELITLRANKEREGEMAMLRERRRALENDLEETYDKLEHERDAHRAAQDGLEAERVRREAWMDSARRDNQRAVEAENQIDGYAAKAERWQRVAILTSSAGVGTVVAAVWGQTLVQFFGGLL